MHDKIFARMYNQVMLNRAYMKTILANQCIIMSKQANRSVDHRVLYEKLHKEVYAQFKRIIKEDQDTLNPDNQSNK